MFASVTGVNARVESQHIVAQQGAGSDDWPTYHRDTSRSGFDPTISNFTAVNLNWKSATLDGQVYAEPLVIGNDVVVATEANSVYELNANNGQTVWHRNLGTPVNGAVLPCGDINPSGITSTPAIDVTSGTIFAVAFLSSPSLHHQLFALDLSTGNIKFQLGIDPSGANPTVQQQRGGLALANGYVYVPYGGLDGDCGSYHGWIAATSANGGGPVISYEVPTGNAGAIWGGGDGPVVDSSGNILVATGNSFSSTTFDYGDAVLTLSPATSPPISLLDWFAPSNWSQLNTEDLDLGSTEPVILNANYLFQIGKEGVGYELNAAHLGNIGGQVYSSQVCTGGNGAYGGLAHASGYLVVPCTNGLTTLTVSPGGNPPFTVQWRGPNYVPGPPIIAGSAVWDVDVTNGLLYVFALSTGQMLFHDTIGSLPTHFNSLSAGDGQIFVPASNQIIAYKPQQTSTTLITGVASGSGSVSPNCPEPSGCNETVDAPISVNATAGSGYLFSHWMLTGVACSSGVSSNPCHFSMPNSPASVSAIFVQPSSTTFSRSPSSISVGSSVTLSGTISPNPGVVSVLINLSQDSGSTWSQLMSVMTDSSGTYSTSWTPGYPDSYLLQAGWNGNNQYAPSQSSSTTLTVTGTTQPTPTLLLSTSSTVSHGQRVTLTLTVFNPTSSGLNANVTIQIIGPNNYAIFDVIQTHVGTDSKSISYYEWTAPNQTGTYIVTISLRPPSPTGVDVENIQVS